MLLAPTPPTPGTHGYSRLRFGRLGGGGLASLSYPRLEGATGQGRESAQFSASRCRLRNSSSQDSPAPCAGDFQDPGGGGGAGRQTAGKRPGEAPPRPRGRRARGRDSGAPFWSRAARGAPLPLPPGPGRGPATISARTATGQVPGPRSSGGAEGGRQAGQRRRVPGPLRRPPLLGARRTRKWEGRAGEGSQGCDAAASAGKRRVPGTAPAAGKGLRRPLGPRRGGGDGVPQGSRGNAGGGGARALGRPVPPPLPPAGTRPIRGAPASP